ncbi:MAG: hypothetical protein JWM32_239 [Verrucomicrobia bacterium]|nr:hypothetical protein [Verrucomicrobiota bacterium]
MRLKPMKTASPSPASPASSTSDRLDRDAIAARAYELWQQSGSEHGRHEDHWYQAERELSGLPPEDLPNEGTKSLPVDRMWTPETRSQ